MADKTINELTAATTMGNDDLLVLQQGGVAKKLSGKQLGDYVYNAATEKVAEVNKAVDDARSSINDIVESVQSMTELGTDTTLTTTGMAADAKAAGDKIAEVDEATRAADEATRAAIESMIAGRETAMKATKNYTSGSLVIVNDILYRLDANVASGETLTLSSNCHTTTIETELAAIKTDLSIFQTETEADIADLDSTKADKTGSYSEMSVGTAEQLVGSSSVTDMVPYSFRKTGGDLTVGKRAEDMLVGGSVVWNQIFGIPSSSRSKTENNVTFTDNRDGTISVTTSGNASADTNIAWSPFSVIDTHKYLFQCTPTGGSASTYYSYLVSASYIEGKTDVGNGYVCKAIGTGAVNAVIMVKSGTNIASAVKFKLQIFDLTQMFGTTIADYIYNLEQITAGAGVAFFRKLFPNDYYAYNAGELMSVKAVSHDTVGFNLWDGEKEQGYIDGNGNNAASITTYRTKNYIPVLPNTSYCYSNGSVTSSIRVSFYDGDKRYISNIYDANAIPRVFTTPTNARYLRFYWDNIDNACISFANPTKNGTYEPYTKHSYPLDSSLELRGIPMLDSNNKLYYDGDTYASDGTVTRKYGIVDLGTLNWTYDTSGGFWHRGVSSVMLRSGNGFAEKYSFYKNSSNVANGRQSGITIYSNGIIYATTGDAQNQPSGYLVYELATPTTETAAPYTNPQVVDPNGTEEYVDTRSVAIPAGHETKYYTDLVQKLEELPTDFSSIIAPTEKSTAASKPYAVGELLILNNVLYKVTSAIASGGTITPGTNVTATTLAAQILALANA